VKSYISIAVNRDATAAEAVFMNMCPYRFRRLFDIEILASQEAKLQRMPKEPTTFHESIALVTEGVAGGIPVNRL